MKKLLLVALFIISTNAMARNFQCEMECQNNGYADAYCQAMCQ